jgi:hypothetical protein
MFFPSFLWKNNFLGNSLIIHSLNYNLDEIKMRKNYANPSINKIKEKFFAQAVEKVVIFGGFYGKECIKKLHI